MSERFFRFATSLLIRGTWLAAFPIFAVYGFFDVPYGFSGVRSSMSFWLREWRTTFDAKKSFP